MPASVEISRVTKSYGTEIVVREVDLSLAAGECVALVGHNGAGKSTLIKMVLGLCRPTSGTVRVYGEDPAGPRGAQLHARLGFLPENVVFPPAMTGYEVLDFYARLKSEDTVRSGALLERVGLGGAARRRVGTYSKGMRQRLGLAQALLGTPKLLLLDEPTSGLDAASRQSFYDIIGELRDNGTTVLLSSHALNEIEGRADRVAVMSHGRLLACGTMPELRGSADLPLRIRIQLTESATDWSPRPLSSLSWQWMGEKRLELTCANSAKLEVLRQISASDLVTDIEVMPPSLDDIYARLMRRAAE